MKQVLKNENYCNIQGWMVKELGLSGNNLIVYAIIYGFSQTDEQYFSGSLRYLSEWTNSTKQGVLKNLKYLCDNGYLEKKTEIINGIIFNKYKAILKQSDDSEGIQQSLIPYNYNGYTTKFNTIQQSLPNNISNNIDTNINNKLSKESLYTENGEIQNDKKEDSISSDEKRSEEILRLNKKYTTNNLGRKKLITDIRQKSTNDLEQKIIGVKELPKQSNLEKTQDKEYINESKKKRYLQSVEKDIITCLGIKDKDKLQYILDWFEVIWDKGVKSTKHKSYIKISQQLLEFFNTYSWEEMKNILDTCIRNSWRDLSWAVPKNSKDKYNNYMKRDATFFDVKDNETKQQYYTRKKEQVEDILSSSEELMKKLKSNEDKV